MLLGLLLLHQSTPMTHTILETRSSKELFKLTDDGSGGWLQTLKRRIKFGLRYRLSSNELLQIRSFFQEHGLSELSHTDLAVIFRSMRPYLWSGLSPTDRTEALLAHFEWLLTRYSADTVVDFYKCGSHTFFTQSHAECLISLDVEPARGLGREGELAMHLKLDGVSVMRAAFSILPAKMVGIQSSGFVMVIGNMQGQRALNHEIKIVTQKMERTRPQNILMTALQGLASGWQLVGMVGVSDACHVYSSYRSLSKRVGLSYDKLWEELGSMGALSTTHWHLPVQWVPRSEQDVPSNKRSQLRRKNEIRQKIFDEVARNCVPLRLSQAIY
jgi:uncharacterized protein VirK/YbjX